MGGRATDPGGADMTGRPPPGVPLEGREWEHYPVLVSTEAAALEWIGCRDAPHGATVTADHEVAPRGRLGTVWDGSGLRASIVVRPEGLGPESEGRLWMMAGLTLVEALQPNATWWWPDRVRVGGADLGHLNVTARFGPGLIDAAAVTFRVPTRPQARWSLLERLVDGLDRRLTVETDRLVEECGAALEVMGQEITVELLPRGTMEGICGGVGVQGGLLVRLGSGREAEVPVAQTRKVMARRPGSRRPAGV